MLQDGEVIEVVRDRLYIRWARLEWAIVVDPYIRPARCLEMSRSLFPDLQPVRAEPPATAGQSRVVMASRHATSRTQRN